MKATERIEACYKDLEGATNVLGRVLVNYGDEIDQDERRALVVAVRALWRTRLRIRRER